MIRGPNSSRIASQNAINSARAHQKGIGHVLYKERQRRLAEKIKSHSTYTRPRISRPRRLSTLTKSYNFYDDNKSDSRKCYNKHGLLKTLGIMILDEMGIINGEDYI